MFEATSPRGTKYHLKFRYSRSRKHNTPRTTICYLTITTNDGYVVSYRHEVTCHSGDQLVKDTGRKLALAAVLAKADLDKEERDFIWAEYHNERQGWTWKPFVISALPVQEKIEGTAMVWGLLSIYIPGWNPGNATVFMEFSFPREVQERIAAGQKQIQGEVLINMAAKTGKNLQFRGWRIDDLASSSPE